MTVVRLHRALMFGALQAACLASVGRADVIISNDSTLNMTCAAGTCLPTEKSAVLNVGDLTSMLASGNLTVTTLYKKGFRTKSAHDLDIAVPISWASNSTLTLTSHEIISVRAPITVMGPGGLVLSPGYPGWKLENRASVTFWDLGSVFKAGSSQFVLAGDLPALVGDIAANPSGAYALANDYDAHDDVFAKAPIPNFQGQFTGLGHAISNLAIKRGSKSCEGLFSGNHGTLRDLTLHAVTVSLDTRSRSVGALAGCNSASIFNVHADGTVNGVGDGSVGGIVGLNGGTVSDAHSAMSVSGGQAGGIAGENDSSILNSSTTGLVTGNVNAGGVVGENRDNGHLSFATSSVTGNNNTGGLIGSNHGIVGNSYALGSVSGNGGAAGGVLGFNAGSVSQTYSIGAVAGEQGYTGGLVGYDPLENIVQSYWDLDTSGISDPHQGAGFPIDDPGIEGLTSAQLQAKLPYGFDKRVWKLEPAVNGGFPYLRFNPPQ